MTVNKDLRWLYDRWLAAVPVGQTGSVVEWAQRNVKLIGSARSETYDAAITPWTKEPVECANNGTRSMTYIKPVQCGGTTVGEIALLYWISVWHGGDIAYYWQSDESADSRWAKSFNKKLLACAPVVARAPAERYQWTKGRVILPHCNFAMLGVRSDRNVATDSYRGVVCEELHDVQGGWEPGKLAQVHGRQTAYWCSVVFHISNAAKKGSELHKAFLSGTQQHWEVLCPGCKQPHRMRTRWDKEHPELGGLKYDADGCRRNDGSYDYLKLLPTIHYQMPCGHRVNNDGNERRALSLSGSYSEPENKGAILTDRSYTLEAVAVDYIPWLSLIQEKHQALLALRLGDPEPWWAYLRERECRFVDASERPMARPIVLSERKKDREGLRDKVARFAALDRQQGLKDEHDQSHFWLLIADFDAAGNCLIVYEGRVDSDGAVVETLRRHEVMPQCVVVDTGWDTKHLYTFCLANGYTAIKMEGDKKYMHRDATWHYWQEVEPLWPQAGLPGPTRDAPEEEPEFFLASKQGAFNLLSYLRSSKERKFEVPSDVSEDFKTHFKAWNLEQHRIPKTNELEMIWRKSSEDAPDHLFCCLSYIVLLASQAGLLTSDFTPAAGLITLPIAAEK